VSLEATIKKHDFLLVSEKCVPLPVQHFVPDTSDIRSAMGFGVQISSVGERWVIETEFGKVQPGATEYSEGFYLGALGNMKVNIEAAAYCDETTPHRCTLTAEVIPGAGKLLTHAELALFRR
jgi:hypothetical protein